MDVKREISSNDGKSKKLFKKYYGPCEIKRVLDKDRYVIEDIKVSQKPYTAEYPEEKLKLWTLDISSKESDTWSEEGDEKDGKGAFYDLYCSGNGYFKVTVAH